MTGRPPETTGKKQTATTFKPGQSGNPKGRPKGSRNALAREFIDGMQKAWEEHGQKVLEAVIKDDPATFLRAMVALMPKELDVSVTQYENMSDDQLKQQYLAAIREASALGIDLGPGSITSVH